MGTGARLFAASPRPHPAEGCGCHRHSPIPTPLHLPGVDGARRGRVRSGATQPRDLGMPRLSGTGADASVGASFGDCRAGRERRTARGGRARRRTVGMRGSAGMADSTTTGPADRPERDSGWQRPSLRPASAPWEGPLVSNTTDLMTGSSGLPEESPAVSGLSNEVRESAGTAGTSPEPASAVRSWPEQSERDAHTGEAPRTDQAAASDQVQPAGTSRRGGTGLSAMLLPELQRLAQSMGIMGTGRMRKGQVIAAIEERQASGGGPGAASAGRQAADRGPRDGQGGNGGSQGAQNDNSVQRGAPAGAGATRLFEQDAMEFETSTPPGVGSGASSGGIGDSSSQGGVGAGAAGDGAPAVTTAGAGAPASVSDADGRGADSRDVS